METLIQNTLHALKRSILAVNQLYHDDYEAYCILIRNKSLETAQKYQKMIQLWCTSNAYSQIMQKILPYNIQSVMNEFRTLHQSSTSDLSEISAGIRLGISKSFFLS